MSDTIHILPCVGNGRTDSMKRNKIHVVRIDFMTGYLSSATVDGFWLSSLPPMIFDCRAREVGWTGPHLLCTEDFDDSRDFIDLHSTNSIPCFYINTVKLLIGGLLLVFW